MNILVVCLNSLLKKKDNMSSLMNELKKFPQTCEDAGIKDYNTKKLVFTNIDTIARIRELIKEKDINLVVGNIHSDVRDELYKLEKPPVIAMPDMYINLPGTQVKWTVY